MNTQNDQTNNVDKTCCVDYCTKVFEISGQQTINYYKCDQGVFSSSNLWNIQKKNKKTLLKYLVGFN